MIFHGDHHKEVLVVRLSLVQLIQGQAEVGVIVLLVRVRCLMKCLR